MDLGKELKKTFLEGIIFALEKELEITQTRLNNAKNRLLDLDFEQDEDFLGDK